MYVYKFKYETGLMFMSFGDGLMDALAKSLQPYPLDGEYVTYEVYEPPEFATKDGRETPIVNKQLSWDAFYWDKTRKRAVLEPHGHEPGLGRWLTLARKRSGLEN
jgi:hypothetical protein